MKFTAAQYAAALYEVLQETAAVDEEKVLDNFAQILRQNGHLGLLPEIEEAFLKQDAKKRGEIPAGVVFARDGRPEKWLLDRLHQLLGKNLSIKQKIDAGILGGVIIETEDTRIDASLKKQLRNLKSQLVD